jgi:hypothetical protein
VRLDLGGKTGQDKTKESEYFQVDDIKPVTYATGFMRSCIRDNLCQNKGMKEDFRPHDTGHFQRAYEGRREPRSREVVLAEATALVHKIVGNEMESCTPASLAEERIRAEGLLAELSYLLNQKGSPPEAYDLLMEDERILRQWLHEERYSNSVH